MFIMNWHVHLEFQFSKCQNVACAFPGIPKTIPYKVKTISLIKLLYNLPFNHVDMYMNGVKWQWENCSFSGIGQSNSLKLYTVHYIHHSHIH